MPRFHSTSSLYRLWCSSLVPNMQSKRGVQSNALEQMTFVTGHKRRRVNKRRRKLSFLFGRVEAKAASVDLPHHRASLSRAFPVKSQEEHAAAEISTRRPSLFQIKTHGGSCTVPRTSVGGAFFFCSFFSPRSFSSAARLPSGSQTEEPA